MPCIQLKVNRPLEEKTKEEIKTRFGKAIACIPGKSEGWLMVCIEDGASLWFRGENNEPIAFAEVMLYGKASAGDYSALTGELSSILQELAGVQPDHFYVKYSETEHWGWNGSNF